MGTVTGFNLPSIIIATVGALIVLFVYNSCAAETQPPIDARAPLAPSLFSAPLAPACLDYPISSTRFVRSMPRLHHFWLRRLITPCNQ